jgi:PAS domain S-box-containing protein
MLDTLLRTTEDAICVLDGQGTFRSMNDSAAAQVGGRPADFVGKTLWSVFPPELAELFAGHVRQVIETRKGLVVETRQPLREGWRWHRTTLEPLNDAEGKVSTVLMIARDITDRKNAEEAQRNSEVRYKTLVEQIPAITYTTALDHDSGVFFVSPQVTELLGFTLEECRNDPKLWKRRLHPDDRDRVLRELAESRNSGHHFTCEYRVIAKDGQIKWFRDEARFVPASDGKPLCLQGIMLDITGQKSAYDAVRRTDELFRQFFGCSPIGMTIHDSHGRLLNANPAAREILGLPNVRQNHSFSLLSDPQLPDDVRARLEAGETVRFETHYDFNRERREGLHDTLRTGTAHLDTLMAPLVDEQTRERTGYLVQIQDISEQKSAEEAARRTEKRFHQLFMSSPIDTEYYDAQGNLIEGNPAAFRTFGVSNVEDVRGMNLFANPNFPAEERARLFATGSCHLEQAYDFDLIRAKNYFKTSKTGIAHIDVQITRLTNEVDGTCTGYLVQAQDITERKLAEMQVARLSEQRQLALDAARMGWWHYDLATQTFKFDDRVRSIFEFEGNQATGEDVFSRIHPDDLAVVRAKMREVLALTTPQPFGFDYRLRLPHGAEHWIENFSYVLFEGQGASRHAVGIFGTVRDVTNRKRAEQRLQQSELQARESFEELQKLMDIAPVAILVANDPECKSISANPVAQRMMRIPDPQAHLAEMPTPFPPPGARFFHDGNEVQVNDLPLHVAALKGLDVRNFETNVIGSSGQITTMLENARPLLSEAGQIRGAICVIMDITERKRIENALREGREEFENLLQSLRDIVWAAKADGSEVLYLNPAFEEVYRRPRSEFFDNPKLLLQVSHLEDRRRVEEAMANFATNGEMDEEYRILRPDGAVRWIRDRRSVVRDANGKLLRIGGIIRDFTDRIINEVALRESRVEFETVLQSLKDVVWAATADSKKLLYLNRAVEEMYGRSRAEFNDNPNIWLEVVHPEDRPRVDKAMVGFDQTCEFDEEYRIVRPDGTIRWVRDRKSMVRDCDGKPVRIGGVIRDVTDRKEFENALYERREEFNAVLNALQDSVWAASVESQQLMYVNPASEAIYGRPNAEFAANGRLWLEVIHPEDRPLVEEAYGRFLQTGHMDEEYRILRPDGSIRWVRDRKFVVRDVSGNPSRIGGTVSDITDHKEADERARSYEHDLRSLTHEILRVEEAERSQLAVDLHDGLTQLLSLTRIKLGALNPAHDAADLPQKFGEICILLDQAMHEARALTFELCPPVLHELGLPSAAAWLSDQMKRRFGLEVRVEENREWKQLPKATNSILFRCLRELLVNVAKHAHATFAEVQFVQTDHHVSLSVTDNGRGFKERFDSEKIPGSGGGNGFGLFSIRQRLEHLGGKLVIKSQPDLGSTVRLDLPLNGENNVPSEHKL